MTIELLVLAGALIYSLVNLVKMAQGGQWKSVSTLVFTYLIGILVVAIIVRTSYASGINVGDVRLDLMNQWDQFLLGFQLASAGNFAYDVIPKSTPTLGTSAPQQE